MKGLWMDDIGSYLEPFIRNVVRFYHLVTEYNSFEQDCSSAYPSQT